MSVRLPPEFLHNFTRPQFTLPIYDAVDRVRESMRQHFYFNIIEYAISIPNDPHVQSITDTDKWQIKFQIFWDELPHNAQSRLMNLFEVMDRDWKQWSPREKEITARATMFQFLQERANNADMHNS